MSKSRKPAPRVDADGYEVGYRKPPQHTRFRPGQSGNRKGRPKGVRNFKTDLRATLTAPVKLSREGKQKNISTQRAMLLRLREKALSGDIRALDLLVHLAQVHNNEDLAVPVELSADDASLLAIYRARVLAGAASPPGSTTRSEPRQVSTTVTDPDRQPRKRERLPRH